MYSEKLRAFGQGLIQHQKHGLRSLGIGEHTSVWRECSCVYSFLLSVNLSSALSTKIIVKELI